MDEGEGQLEDDTTENTRRPRTEGSTEDTETDEEVHLPAEPSAQQSPLLSPPAYVPINYNTDDNTSDDNGGNASNKVKFSRVAEVCLYHFGNFELDLNIFK